MYILVIFVLLVAIVFISLRYNNKNIHHEWFGKIINKEEYNTAKYPVIISVTTSPKRLQNCLDNLVTMLKDNVVPSFAEIHLNLPRTFKRTGEIYPQIQSPTGRIKIFRDMEDEGPATKLLPTLDRMHGVNALIITWDDDTTYTKGTIEIHIELANLYNLQCVTAFSCIGDHNTGHSFSHPELISILAERGAKIPLKVSYVPHELSQCAEGYMSVGYPSNIVDPEIIRKNLNISDKCKNSDDIMISLSLHEMHIPILHIIGDDIFENGPTRQNFYGFEDDALHMIQSHMDKYEMCSKIINSQ